MEINIDATNAIAGRLAVRAAKEALQGKTVNILHAEKAIITGNPVLTKQRYHETRTEKGQPRKGPYIPRMPDRFLKRLIRGMLPHKQTRGEEAYKRIKCYIGLPEEFKDKKLEKVCKEASALPTLKYTTIQEICRFMGGKV